MPTRTPEDDHTNDNNDIYYVVNDNVVSHNNNEVKEFDPVCFDVNSFFEYCHDILLPLHPKGYNVKEGTR